MDDIITIVRIMLCCAQNVVGLTDAAVVDVVGIGNPVDDLTASVAKIDID